MVAADPLIRGGVHVHVRDLLVTQHVIDVRVPIDCQQDFVRCFAQDALYLFRIVDGPCTGKRLM